VNGGSETARKQGGDWLKSIETHLSEAGLGHISEICEGDAPHRPCGCVAQAWSVAEVLRTYVEDVKGIQPRTAPTSHRSQAAVRQASTITVTA